MAEQQEKNTVGKCSVFWLVIFSALASASSIILVILLASWGNTGFVGSSSISVGTCTQPYFTIKYQNMATINSAIFVFSCIAAFTSSILLLVFIAWICKKCCSDLRPSTSTKGALYFLISITLMAATPPLGYYLSFLFEFPQCSNNIIDATNSIVVVFLAGGIIISVFLLLIMVLFQDYGQEREEKYRQMNSYQTQANEQSKERERNLLREIMREERRSPAVTKQEYTKQNIHITRQIIRDSPPRRRAQQPKIYLEARRQEDLRSNFLEPPRAINRSPIPKQQVLTQNLHPSLRNIDPHRYFSSKYDPEDDRSFRKQAIKYYDNDRRGILSRGQFEQRDMRDYDRPYANRRDDRQDRYSPPRRERGRDDYRTPQRRRGEYNRQESPYENRRDSPYRQGIMRTYGKYR